jgi:hypothetical protein
LSTKNVAVERNVYFRTSAPLEGEDEEPMEADSEQPVALNAPSTPPSTESPSMPALVDADADNDNDNDVAEPVKPQQQQPLKSTPPPLRRFECLWKPSRIVQDLQSGKGVTLSRVGSPSVTLGLQMPDLVKEEEEEAEGVWVVIDGSPALLEEFDGLEHVLLAETSDAEALEPWTLAEAKHCPNWLWWEKAIGEELATLEAAGTWVLEEPPPGANIISSKWVFKAKKDAMGIIA